MNSNRLLIIDGELSVCNQISNAAKECGFDVFVVHDGDGFRSTVSTQPPSALVLDLGLSGEDGISMLSFLAERNFRVPIVLMSNLDARVLGTAERIAKARGLSVVGTLRKPFTIADLERTLDALGRQCPVFTVDEFRNALLEDQLTIHYQPIVDIRNKTTPTIKSCEALVRWNHPRHGLLPPRDFIPFVETSDLIVDLTLFVLDGALRQVSRWQEGGYELPVSVNVPVSFLSQDSLPVWMTMVLQKHSVSASDLILEITERDVVSDVNQVMETLIRLRLLGIRLSIDDFGIGHSSLRQLQQMPFSDVKIDRSFISELPSQSDARDIVRSTIDLAHRLGLNVCAEGVETEAALNILHDMGCERAQGFYFWKPVDADELLPLLAMHAVPAQGDAACERSLLRTVATGGR